MTVETFSSDEITINANTVQSRSTLDFLVEAIDSYTQKDITDIQVEIIREIFRMYACEEDMFDVTIEVHPELSRPQVMEGVAATLKNKEDLLRAHMHREIDALKKVGEYLKSEAALFATHFDIYGNEPDRGELWSV